jgi:hypothetical protein
MILCPTLFEDDSLLFNILLLLFFSEPHNYS